MKLLEVLEYRRDHFPEERLYVAELQIFARLDAFDKLLSLSEAGTKRFPKNINFYFYLIHSLFKKGLHERLKSYLTDDLLNVAFGRNQRFEIARICALNGKLELGLELCYRETTAYYESPSVKQAYIAFLLHHPRVDPWPEKVSEGTWILIQHKDKQELLEITRVAASENPFAHQALGKSVGDQYSVKPLFKTQPENITILHIYDRYSGLFNKILKETESGVSGMGFQTFKFDSSNPETFLQTLVKELGADGDQRKKNHEDAFKDYDAGKISFTELVRASHNRIFNVYSFLTGPFSNGFKTIPLTAFRGQAISNDKELVIDLSTVFALHEISAKHKGILKHKFIISQYAIEIIEEELQDAMLHGDSRATLTVTSQRATPYFEQPEVSRNRIERLKQLLTWIRENCETRFSNEKLNMSIKHPDILRENDPYYNYMVDTIFLAQSRVLISDDLFHYQKFSESYQKASLEFYLHQFHHDVYRKELLPFLIEQHYIGIRIYSDDLKREFKKPVYGGKTTYDYCLENLPFHVNQDTDILADCAEFAKFIYLEPITLDIKKQYTQKLFLHCLKKFPDPIWLKKALPSLLLIQFHLLLPEYQESVIDDATAALEILNRTL